MSQRLNKELEKVIGGHCEAAPRDTEYPYIVFSAARLGDEGGKQTYSLEVNVWDQHEYYSRAENMMDNLEKKLHRCNFQGEDFLIRIFKGRRQNVPDPDKDIKRVREQFEMQVYELED